MNTEADCQPAAALQVDVTSEPDMRATAQMALETFG
jgi:hypothetical protein